MEQAGLRLVYRQLDNDLNENALFLLERLQAIEPDNSSLTHLQSLCCLRLQRFASAVEYSRDKGITGEHVGCSYVFAQSCLHQEHYSEGITALEQARRNWDGSGTCGIPLNVANVFKFKSPPTSKEHHRHPPATADEDTSFSTRDDPSKIDTEDRAYRSARGAASKFLPNTNLPLSTKRKQPSGLDIFAPDMEGLHVQASRKENSGSIGSVMTQRRSARLNQATSATLTDRRTTEPNAKKDAFKRLEKQWTIVHPTTRRSATLKRRTNATRSSDSVAGQDAKTKNDRATSQVAETDHSTEFPNVAISRDQDKLQPLVQLFARLGTAYYHLRRFQPQVCLDTLASLPAEQQATPWVISKIARSQYELQNYKDAKATFQVLRRVAPSWVEELEVYSIVLWHLNDDVELAFHAHELTDSHFLAPQTWCAVGNSFSLQKAHPDAIKCFKRATQLQPQLAHSYSLLGHECIDAEQYDEAVTAFHRALQVDACHYVALVGLGRVQEKLGKLEVALKNYMSAESINPTNGVLLTHIARRAAKLDLPVKLLAYAKLQSARLLLRLGSATEALQELHLAEQIAPDEPDVHFMLGKAHLLDNNKGRALKCFTIAMSLNPRNEAIRQAISSLDDSNDEGHS
ncbi:anaphase-promoting complex subunit 3 [Fusarium proliferatum]|nr:anaphase-promoting complex subunit 3 [Fusarium proliferatum]